MTLRRFGIFSVPATLGDWMQATLKLLARDERGAVMTEYGLLATLIAIVAFVAVKVFGQNVSSLYSTIDSSV